jgi:ribonuclease P protein component
MTCESFPRAARLVDSRDFRRVFRRGRRLGDPWFTMVVASNGGTCARLGLAISRKAARRATDRNRIKRLIRETFRRRKAALGGRDIVLLARPAARDVSKARLSADLDALFQTLSDDAISINRDNQGLRLRD